jgi:hypothetical protein
MDHGVEVTLRRMPPCLAMMAIEFRPNDLASPRTPLRIDGFPPNLERIGCADARRRGYPAPA